GTEQRASLAGEVAEDFALHCRLEQRTATDADAQRQAAIAPAAGCILVNRVARGDALAVHEATSKSGARTARGNQEHVDVGRRDDTGLIRVDDAEAMCEDKRLALLETWTHGRPLLFLTGIGEEVQQQGAALRRLVQ